MSIDVRALFPPHVQAVVEALAGHEVRVVGGAVRAWLRGECIDGVEVDLATTATPDEMISAFKAASIPHDTSAARYGCVAAYPFTPQAVEVTSLRAEIYVPGSRYPTVQFGVDWQTDAGRRDFTFNAISVAPSGMLFDPFDGASHLRDGRVVFIGEPLKRLSEDPLRLFRFFRFCGLYGLGGYTPDVESAVKLAVPEIATLSRKKVADELAGIRATPYAAKVLNAMKHAGIGVE